MSGGAWRYEGTEFLAALRSILAAEVEDPGGARPKERWTESMRFLMHRQLMETAGIWFVASALAELTDAVPDCHVEINPALGPGNGDPREEAAALRARTVIVAVMDKDPDLARTELAAAPALFDVALTAAYLLGYAGTVLRSIPQIQLDAQDYEVRRGALWN